MNIVVIAICAVICGADVDIRDVGEPDGIGLFGLEILLQKLGGDRQIVLRIGRHDPVLALGAGSQAGVLHDLGNRVQRARDAACLQFAINTRASAIGTDLAVNSSNVFHECLVVVADGWVAASANGNIPLG